VQVIVDGDNANTAATVVGYAQAGRRSSTAVRVAAPPRRGRRGGVGVVRAAGITLEPRIWYNPQLRSTLFLVPGLIAYIAMITAVVSTALSIVREKERGTMEQVRMAPISPLAFILGKTTPYLVHLVLLGAAHHVRARAVRPADARLVAAAVRLSILLFLVGAQAQGLLISTIATTQQVAFQVALLSSFLPTFILSGFIFPLSSMPTPMQVVSHIVPARYFLVALRGIVLKGAGLEAFWEQLGRWRCSRRWCWGWRRCGCGGSGK
jgi:ABC-2 type transport system permease protein